MVDITTKIGKLELKNPTVLASGILGVTGSSLVNVAKNGAGAVTSKSIGLSERKGHPSPILISIDNGMMNAVGLSNPGVDDAIKEIEYFKQNSDAPIIASIFAPNIEDFGKIAEKISAGKPDIIEVNVSCPNVQSEFGKPFGSDPKLSAEVTQAVKKKTSVPICVKLTPNVPNIKEIAVAVEKAGADAISAINTVGPGMKIDLLTRKPILANKAGGMSGPIIKPIAVRCVYDIYSVVKVPVLGIGGVTYGTDAIEMIMAGASAVGIGSGVYYRGVDVFKKVSEEIKNFMSDNNFSSLKEMIGAAHE